MNPNANRWLCTRHMLFSLRCWFGWHMRTPIKMLSGMRERECTGRRGCWRCGRIDIRKHGTWLFWGYVRTSWFVLDGHELLHEIDRASSLKPIDEKKHTR